MLFQYMIMHCDFTCIIFCISFKMKLLKKIAKKRSSIKQVTTCFTLSTLSTIKFRGEISLYRDFNKYKTKKSTECVKGSSRKMNYQT